MFCDMFNSKWQKQDKSKKTNIIKVVPNIKHHVFLNSI